MLRALVTQELADINQTVCGGFVHATRKTALEVYSHELRIKNQ